MQNVYDIRRKKNLYFILSEKIAVNNKLMNYSCAVIIFLYYKETLNKYFSYIDNIESNIDIYIVSNNTKIFIDILQYIKKSPKCIQLIKSQNRGRDVSALLVACRDILQGYEYICFVHDKKRKNYISDEAFELWIDNLWGNTLGSNVYISNILHLLDSDKKMGLLVPPEPIGKFSPILYGNNLWGNDFELTQQLARELDLNCEMNKNKPPITLGMCFWVKSCALKKLYEKKWKYESFDEEPLKDDGTISHAIERILGYVAQDAGYLTGTVMQISYAEKILAMIQEQAFSMYRLLSNTYGMQNLEKFLETKDRIQRFYMRNKLIYLYGAGEIGKNCMQLMRAIECKPAGYLVTDKSKCKDRIEGIPVKSINEIENFEKVGIIITVSDSLQDEIETILIANGIKNYIKY